LKKWTLHFKTVVSIEPLAIWIKFAGYVRSILVCKLCKFGEYICWNPTDIEFFTGVTFLAGPVDCGDSCCLNHASLLEGAQYSYDLLVMCIWVETGWCRWCVSEWCVGDVCWSQSMISTWSTNTSQFGWSKRMWVGLLLRSHILTLNTGFTVMSAHSFDYFICG